jgi:hypothetical protein
MALSVEHANVLQVEITNLEFKKEIFKYQGIGIHIDDYTDELEAREAQIAELRSRLDQLISASPETEQMASAIHNQQTRPLISSLPFEILSVVFKHATWSRTTFAKSVSQVSRYWREIAIQTPFLWSEICLFPWRTGTGYREFLYILLQRSQSHPLDITLTLRELDNPNHRVNRAIAILHATRQSGSISPHIPMNLDQQSGDHCLHAQLGIFIPHVSRWRTFRYECENINDVWLVNEPLTKLSAPMLASFDLLLSGRMDEEDGDAWGIFQGGAPKLSQLHIRGIHPFACLPPLSSVTTLCLGAGPDQMNGEEFLCMLRDMPTLVSLCLEGMVVEPNGLYLTAVRGGNVEIATLRSFSFSADEPSIGSILNTIRCPGVESMNISSVEEWEGMDLSELPSIQALPLPPFPLLRTLELNGIECDKLATNFDFSYLPVLHTISLSSCTSPMALLRLLLPYPNLTGNGIVWPLLQVIKLSHVGAEEIDGICRIITHRIASGNPIDTIYFDPVSLGKFPDKVEWIKQHVIVPRGRRVHYFTQLTKFPMKARMAE